MADDPWGGCLVAHIAQKMWFNPADIPLTPGELAAREAMARPEYHQLPQVERDKLIREAWEKATWDT